MNKKNKIEAPSETGIINSVSEVVALAVQTLPSEWGDRLNFLADLIAGLALIYLWSEDILPKEQVLLSFSFLLVFFILCFSGSILMRIINKRETPG